MEEEEAAALAETLRKTIEETVSCPDRSPVSASLGVTQAREGETFESFYHKMDSALYQAKFRGKNTIFSCKEIRHLWGDGFLSGSLWDLG